MSNIRQNIEFIRHKIEQACRKADRPVKDDVTLMAVSKTVDISRIQEAHAAGIRIFGENKVQELKDKLQAQPSEFVFHMIGHLQSNKAKDAISIFKMIQSVDSLHLAEKLQKLLEQKNRQMDILLEVNIGEEKTKFGFIESALKKSYDQISQFKNLTVRGLMTVAPFSENPEDSRIYFKRMKKHFDEIGNLSILSMGMSHDYTIAIEEGSTMIRVGEAIFGRRIQ
jgi:pyridoxal phosphate enzyme (YggS family)